MGFDLEPGTSPTATISVTVTETHTNKFERDSQHSDSETRSGRASRALPTGVPALAAAH